MMLKALYLLNVIDELRTPVISAKWRCGERMCADFDAPLKICKNGVHVCRDEKDALDWLTCDVFAPVIETSKEYIEGDNKRAYRWVVTGDPLPGWNAHSRKMFAIDCARMALNRCATTKATRHGHALLDIAVGFFEGYCDRPDPQDAGNCLRTMGDNYMANIIDLALTGDVTYTVDKARAVGDEELEETMKNEQAELLARYLAGEVGPLVEEERP